MMLKAAHTIGRGHISDMDWSSNGAQIAVAGSCGVWLYDTANWDAAPELRIASRGALTLVKFSPDGAHLATATAYGNIRVWTAAGALTHVFEEPRGEIHTLAWSPDGALLACGGQDGMVYVWQIATGRRWLALRLPALEPDISPLGAPVHGVAFSPDGQHLAAGSRDGFVRVWDAATGAPVRILKEKGRWITDIAYSPDGKTLAASRVDGSAWVWDAANGEDLFVMDGHAGTVDRVLYNPRVGANGPVIASCGGDGEVVLWAAGSGDYLGALSGHLNGVVTAAFKQDGSQLAVAAWDGALRIWDVSGAPGSGTLRQTIQGHADAVIGLDWS
ncbi:MAG: WD40 repeat domain-containing protein, partial [Anaerolineae bacterium]|nr:WD40 repeat domain-containing protein [Anaerolineae bacterium]